MRIKLIETVYQNGKPVACQVVNNYTTQAWLREIKRLQGLQDMKMLIYKDTLDCDKGTCEREVWL